MFEVRGNYIIEQPIKPLSAYLLSYLTGWVIGEQSTKSSNQVFCCSQRLRECQDWWKFKHSVLSTLATNVVSSIGFPASTTPTSVVVESILLSKKDLVCCSQQRQPKSSQKLPRISTHVNPWSSMAPDMSSHGKPSQITRFQQRHGCIHQTPVRLHRKKAHIESFTHTTRCTEELPQFGLEGQTILGSPERSSIYGNLVMSAYHFEESILKKTSSKMLIHRIPNNES